MDETQVNFLEYDLDWSELEDLPSDHVAAFAVLSCAVSEINLFRKMYIAMAHPNIELTGVDSASNMSKFTILRSWSSKLFEIAESLRLIHVKNETEDPVLLEIARFASNEFEPLRKSEGMQVARYLRNEASHHYSFSAAKSNLKHVNKKGDFNFYTHDTGGNDFYPIGEEVLFHARLNRKWANVTSQRDRNKLFGEWLDWSQRATDWLHIVHAMMASEFIFRPLNRNEIHPTSYVIPRGFVGDLNEQKLPLFYEKSKQ